MLHTAVVAAKYFDALRCILNVNAQCADIPSGRAIQFMFGGFGERKMPK